MKLRTIHVRAPSYNNYSLCGKWKSTPDFTASPGEENIKACAKCLAAQRAADKRKAKEALKDEENRAAPRERITLATRSGKYVGRFRGKSALIRKEAENWAKYCSKKMKLDILGVFQVVDYYGDEIGPPVYITFEW